MSSNQTSPATLRSLPIAPLILPTAATQTVRSALGVGSDTTLRIAYLAGPGDILGTYRHWEAGENDPRVPSRTYSAMFYDLAEALDATTLLVASTEQSETTPAVAGRHRFECVVPQPAPTRARQRASAIERSARTEVLVARFDPHVVVVANDHPWALDLAALKRRATVLSLHNTLWQPGWPHAIRAQLRYARAARRLLGIVATSPACARQSAKLAGRRARIQTETPQAAWSVKPRVRDQARKLLFLGRMERFKGEFVLLKAFASVVDKLPDAELTLAGDGPSLPDLRSAAQGIPRVSIPGRLSAREVHEALSRADLLIAPTTAAFPEGLALTCLEAAQHGVPSLITSVVPAGEFLGDGALVVPPGDPSALEAAILRLNQAPEEVSMRSLAATTRAELMSDPERSWAMCLYRILAESQPPKH